MKSYMQWIREQVASNPEGCFIPERCKIPEIIYNAGASEKEAEMLRFFDWFLEEDYRILDYVGPEGPVSRRAIPKEALTYWRANVDNKMEGV